MAQSGYTPISLYYSTTASAQPTGANLVAGELALNTLDEKLYFKNSAGTVKLLASSASTTNVQTISFGSTGLTPSTATSGAVTVAGTLAVGNGGTGITSFGTGVAGALGQNVSGSGSIALTTSPVFTTPNLGTPSAVTLTSATGLPLSTGVTGTLAITNGGTGSTSTTYCSLTTNVTGTLPIANGGTGQTTASTAFNALSPLTTLGDILYGGASGAGTRLGIGSTSQVLTVVGGVPAWSTPASGGVTTISFGSTGLTPSTATSGAVSVAGTLAIANGGTGSTSTTYCSLTSNVTGTLPIANGGTGAVSLRAATIATLGYTTTATAAGTTTLTATSTATQFFTGSTTQTVVLPVASTMTQGQQFTIHNNSSGNLTVNSSGSNLVATLTANTTATITCILTSGTDALSWDADFTGFTTALPVTRGGTGATTLTAYAVVCGGTTSTGAVQSIASVGTTGQVLTSNGAGALPTFQAAGGGFPSGTRMSFQQTAAPTGWTKDTTAAINDSILRLVTGTVTTGGSTGFSTWNAQTATGATTLSISQIPSHNHSGTGLSGDVGSNESGNYNYNPTNNANVPPAQPFAVKPQGGGTSHTHSLTQSLKYYDFIIASAN